MKGPGQRTEERQGTSRAGCAGAPARLLTLSKADFPSSSASSSPCSRCGCLGCGVPGSLAMLGAGLGATEAAAEATADPAGDGAAVSLPSALRLPLRLGVPVLLRLVLGLGYLTTLPAASWRSVFRVGMRAYHFSFFLELALFIFHGPSHTERNGDLRGARASLLAPQPPPPEW